MDRIYNDIDIFNTNLRVTYYARVSTDNDSQNSSIINQNDFFVNYISKNSNWVLVSGYVDEGISGKSVYNRINFLKMIDDGINNKFDLILTKSVSRFARNTIDSIKYTDILKEKGVGVFFVNDNINTFSSDSEFRLTLMASIAQDEIRKLSDSVKFGLKQSINRGVVLGNSNILGYKKNKGSLMIIEDEAIIVRDIFNLFVTNKYNYREVSDIINDRYNKKYDSTSIKRILTNYKYKGYYCGRKSKVINYKLNKRVNLSCNDWIIYKDNSNIPPIVSELLWDNVNNIIASRKNSGKYSVYCGIHNSKCRYILKKYKNMVYKYYYCKNCFSIRECLLLRIVNDYVVKKIVVYKVFECLKIVMNVNN